MLMSFNSTRSSVGVPVFAPCAEPCLRRCAPGWLSSDPGIASVAGGATAAVAGGAAGGAGGTTAGGAAAGGAGGLASAAGFGSAAGFPSATGFGSAGLASARLPSGGAAAVADFEDRLGGSCGFSVIFAGALSRVGVFSVGFSDCSCGRLFPTGFEVLSLLLAKFPSLPGR